MKNILFMHYELHFYRIPIYNKLSEKLKNQGVNLIIWPEKILNNKNEINFNLIEKEFNMNNYKQTIDKYNIECVINFLQPRSPSFYFYIKMILYTSIIKRLPIIYYGHGLNLESKSIVNNIFYNSLHFFYSSIILYTPNEVTKLWNIHHKKIEIAYNTLDLSDRDNLITDTRINIRKSYDINDEFIILFSGRIEKRKNIDILIDFINKLNNKKIKLLVVGPTNDKNIEDELTSNEKILYLGPVYDKKKMAEIFYISDIFSIPGHIGLGLIEAFYWGLPVLTLDVKHAPEIYYLDDSKNGFLLKDTTELNNKFLELSNNKILLEKLSNNAQKTYEERANINNMINGFIISIKKVLG